MRYTRLPLPLLLATREKILQQISSEVRGSRPDLTLPVARADRYMSTNAASVSGG